MAETVSVRIADREFAVQVESFDGGQAVLTIDGQQYTVSVNVPSGAEAKPPADTGSTTSLPSPAPAVSPATAATTPAAGGGKVFSAQMPGTVLRLAVKTGQEVQSGDLLLVIEAMKMENEIRSDRSGRIAEVLVKPGQQVQTGDGLVSFR